MARRYEFYFQVARAISHSFAALTPETLLFPLEHKIHIFELTSNVLLLFWYTNDGVYDDFWKISDYCWLLLWNETR